MKWFFIVLATLTLIQRYDKNHFILIQFQTERLTENLQVVIAEDRPYKTKAYRIYFIIENTKYA